MKDNVTWKYWVGSIVKRLLAAGGAMLVARGVLTREESDVAQTLLMPEIVEAVIGLAMIGASFIGSRVWAPVRARIANDVLAGRG